MGQLDFKACVDLAVRRSPGLTHSALEIEIRRLDESDAKWSYVPPVSMQSTYFLTGPEKTDLNTLHTMVFNVGPYNPVMTYFSVKATRLLRQVAVLKHLQTIAEGLYSLGQQFLELEALDKTAAAQAEIAAVTKDKVRYDHEREKLGRETPLQTQISAQEAAVVEAESDNLAAQRLARLDFIKAFLRLETLQPEDLKLKEAKDQILGRFDPSAATWEQVKANSYEMQALELTARLQDLNVYSSYAKFMPNFNLGLKNPDPISTTSNRQEYYAYIGIDFNIWNSFKDVHNVSRQKAISRQFESKGEVKKEDLNTQWLLAQRRFRAAAAGLKLARGQEDLTRLQVRQAEIAHQTSLPLPAVLTARVNHLVARKKGIAAGLEYDLAVLNLRHLTGDLMKSHVKVAPWRE
ncbi:MAG: TolC family protein [Thermodesulfobacteriota bacterium]